MFDIRDDDLSGAQTRALLALHMAEMQRHSPADSVFALDLPGLQSPDISVLTAWDGERVAGIGALRTIRPAQGEVKSMRTHPDYLRRGVAARLLRHIICVARSRRMKRLSLETGSGAAFDPAIALYRAHGFTAGDAFGDYARSDFNQFMHLNL